MNDLIPRSFVANMDIIKNKNKSDCKSNFSYVLTAEEITDHLPTIDIVASVILTVLYVPVFLLSLLGNISALIIMIKTISRNTRIKNLFIVNLAITDLSGKSCVCVCIPLTYSVTS